MANYNRIPKVWTREAQDIAVFMSQQGDSPREISKVVGVSRTTVTKYLHRIGVRKLAQRDEDALKAPRPLPAMPATVRYEDVPHAALSKEPKGKVPSRALQHSVYGCAALMCLGG